MKCVFHIIKKLKNTNATWLNTTYLGGEGDPEEPLLRRPPRPPLLSGVEPRDLDLVRDLERPRGGVLES